LVRKIVGGDYAINLIQVGLAINEKWYLLRLDQAVIEFSRGNTNLANSIVERIVSITSYEDIKHQLILPINVASELARFKYKTNPRYALEYLLLAKSSIKKGMYDYHRYFDTLVRVYYSLDMKPEAVKAIKEGKAHLAGPDWALKQLESWWIKYLASTSPDELLVWIEQQYAIDSPLPNKIIRSLLVTVPDKLLSWFTARYGYDSLLPDNIIRPLVKYTLDKGDFEASSKLLTRASNTDLLCFSLIKTYRKDNRSEIISFLHSLTTHNKASDNEASTLNNENIKIFANQIAEMLHEKEEQPLILIQRAILRCGIDLIRALAEKAIQIDSEGGMMVTNNSRRRTVGGIFFFLLRKNVTKSAWSYINIFVESQSAK